jgi:uncharacterized repeat protein (TIGR01451 family)
VRNAYCFYFSICFRSCKVLSAKLSRINSTWRLFFIGVLFVTLFLRPVQAQARGTGVSEWGVVPAEPNAPFADTDLSITQTDSSDPVVAGTLLDYVITASNGGGDATGVVVTDTLPASLTFVSADASQGICDFSGGMVSCNLGSLASAASAVITLTVSPNSGGTVTNSVHISTNDNDTDPSNNSDSETTDVQTGTPTICYAAADNGNILVTLTRSN